MKRGEFLKNIAIATIGLTIVPELVLEKHNDDWSKDDFSEGLRETYIRLMQEQIRRDTDRVLFFGESVFPGKTEMYGFKIMRYTKFPE